MSDENIQSLSDESIDDTESPSAVPVYPKFNHPCVNEWMDAMNKGELSYQCFQKHWREPVPKIYSPELNGTCLDWNFDEEKAQKILIDPLEEFICNGDPQVVLKQLSQMDNVVCGKVFKMGDPTYNCRECGMDRSDMCPMRGLFQAISPSKSQV